MNFSDGSFWILTVIIGILILLVGWLGKEYGKNQVQAPIVELKALFNKLNDSLTKLLDFMARQDEKNLNTNNQIQLLWNKISSMRLEAEERGSIFADIKHKVNNLEAYSEELEEKYQENKLSILRHDEKIEDLNNKFFEHLNNK
ncbi:MAG: hypothetical protein KIT33_15435 [Candidatus Kapabacteria bacterium]|nr:hypothetical protein [Ignavibacteriota bacterium]MCW5886362.1 hypothetical protein [Candidatus Kapabacteria bacterium]